MTRRLMLVPVAVLLAAATATANGCSSVDLASAVEVTDVATGYYDAGLNPAGLNKLVPSITFKLRNKGNQHLSSVAINAAFWKDGDDGPLDDLQINAIGGSGLAGGASTEPIVIRSSIGYTLEQPRAELFAHSLFRDMTAKLFGKRGGRIVRLGEFKLERRLLLRAPTDPARP